MHSRKGKIITRAQVSDRPNKGAIYMTYQWWIGACNELVTENLSPITKTPEYKYCAVRVEPIADQRAAEQYVIDEYNKLKNSPARSGTGVIPLKLTLKAAILPNAFVSIRKRLSVSDFLYIPAQSNQPILVISDVFSVVLLFQSRLQMRIIFTQFSSRPNVIILYI